MLVHKKGTKTTVPDKQNNILFLVVILIKNINLLWHEKLYISSHFIHTAARIGAIDWTGLTVSIFHLPIVIVQNCHKFFKRGTPQLVCSLCLVFGRLKQMLDYNWGSFSSRPPLCLCTWHGIQTRTTTPTS